MSKQFHKDLSVLISIGVQMDKFYERSRKEIDHYMQKFIILTQKFNEKYAHVQLKVVQRIDRIHLKLFLDAASLQDAFKEASKIQGLQGASSKGFEYVSQNIQDEVAKATDELYLRYMHPEIGYGSIYLRLDSKEKKVQMVYDPETIVNEPSQEYQLAALYGDKEMDSTIHFENEARTMGFSDVLDNIERRKYHERFDPYFGV